MNLREKCFQFECFPPQNQNASSEGRNVLIRVLQIESNSQKMSTKKTCS